MVEYSVINKTLLLHFLRYREHCIREGLKVEEPEDRKEGCEMLSSELDPEIAILILPLQPPALGLYETRPPNS